MTTTDITPELRGSLSLLNVEQVCELLQVKDSWLWAQCRAGSFPHIRMARQLRFRPEQVQSWLDAQTVDLTFP